MLIILSKSLYSTRSSQGSLKELTKSRCIRRSFTRLGYATWLVQQWPSPRRGCASDNHPVHSLKLVLLVKSKRDAAAAAAESMTLPAGAKANRPKQSCVFHFPRICMATRRRCSHGGTPHSNNLSHQGNPSQRCPLLRLLVNQLNSPSS